MEEIFNKKIEIDTFILVNEIDNFNLIDQLIEDVKEGVKTSSVSRKTNVTGEHTEFDFLKSNGRFHQLLKIIQPSIYKIYKGNFIVRDAWGNIYKNINDFAHPHTHEVTAFCGILYCTDGPGPGTYFSQHDLLIKEKKGRFVLFHPKLLHEVKPYPLEKERITISWNFSAINPWYDVSQAYFIKNNLNI